MSKIAQILYISDMINNGYTEVYYYVTKVLAFLLLRGLIKWTD